METFPLFSRGIFVACRKKKMADDWCCCSEADLEQQEQPNSHALFGVLGVDEVVIEVKVLSLSPFLLSSTHAQKKKRFFTEEGLFPPRRHVDKTASTTAHPKTSTTATETTAGASCSKADPAVAKYASVSDTSAISLISGATASSLPPLQEIPFSVAIGRVTGVGTAVEGTVSGDFMLVLPAASSTAVGSGAAAATGWPDERQRPQLFLLTVKKASKSVEAVVQRQRLQRKREAGLGIVAVDEEVEEAGETCANTKVEESVADNCEAGEACKTREASSSAEGFEEKAAAAKNLVMTTTGLVLRTPFYFCVPMSHQLLQQLQQPNLEDSGSLLSFAAAFPAHLEAVECCFSKGMRLEKGQSLAIWCSSLLKIRALLQWLLPLEVAAIHVCLLVHSSQDAAANAPAAGSPDNDGVVNGGASADDAFDAFLSHPAVHPFTHKLQIHMVSHTAAADILLAATAGLGVDLVLLLPPSSKTTSCASAPSTLEKEQSFHSNSRISCGLVGGKGLLTAALACLAVEGQIVLSSACTENFIEAVDEAEFSCMRQKAAALAFLPISAEHRKLSLSLGIKLHAAAQVLRAVRAGGLWSPKIEEVKRFSLQNIREAVEFVNQEIFLIVIPDA